MPRLLLLAVTSASALGSTVRTGLTAGHELTHSIRLVPDASAAAPGTAPVARAYVTRHTLAPEELAAPMKFEVALAFRNFDELEARLAHREIIPAAELRARYLPLAADYARVRAWLEDAGFEITGTDDRQIACFARGSVQRVSDSLGATFARVASPDGEFTSAVTAPVVPADLGGVIRGIHGLQPHIRLRRAAVMPQPASLTSNAPPFTPAQIAHAYQADGLGLTGAGETIAIYSLATPQNSDLTAFWTKLGIPYSLANVQTVPVGEPSSSAAADPVLEATLDVEWATAMAPGAAIRLYVADSTNPVADDELIQQILADVPTHPSLHQVTISYGYTEDEVDRDYLGIEAQYMAALVSSGVTVFAASGDTGALTDNHVALSVPASMPDVTAVGGTALTLTATNTIASEAAWGDLSNSGSTGGSGGGISIAYARPAWQSGIGLPGTMRLVPDVAAIADVHTGAFVVYNGTDREVGGTSLSSPIWAAFCALLNQARIAAGKGPLGALNPRLYPLINTPAFHDIVAGGNSLYAAGPGYDLVTGLGTPNVGALLTSTMADTFAPVIEIESGDRFSTPGTPVTFYVIATGSPAPTFRWQRQNAATTTWTDLSEDATYSGVASYALMIASPSLALNGDRFRCVVTNSSGSVTSNPETLTMASFGVATLAGWPEWSGFADGRGSNGRFNFAGSVRTDEAGTIYVADASNNTIRKITPDGVVSTVAGAAGQAGATDGGAASARFDGPAGVAIDQAGNIFVADSQNYTVRKITAAGVVSTVAGTAGSRGVVDGNGLSAKFYDPENLALDGAGNIYVADGAGNCVRKVTPMGVVTTLAGSATPGTADGTGSAARFNLPAGVAVDAGGNVYVGDGLNNAVRKITPAGVVTTLAGRAGAAAGFVDGTGGAARFSFPSGLAIDAAGNVFVADQGNNALRMITPTGVVTTVAGSASDPNNVDGPFAVARFYGPADVAIGPDGVLYVADGSDCTVRRVTLAPAIATGPATQSVSLGASVALNVVAIGTGPYAYQWFKDGTAIGGAKTASYTTTASVATGGTYTVTVSTPSGTLTSSPAAVSIANASATTSTLTNLSVRTTAGEGEQTLIAGFVVRGTPSKPLLIRAVGPSLTAYGVSNPTVDPVLTVLRHDASTAASNDTWTSSDAAAMEALGAFPLMAGSKDAALFTTLSEGLYSAKVVDAAASKGIALVEVYDAAGGVGARLINLSARAQVGTGGGVLIAGFVISDGGGKRVLIRGAGPALTAYSIAGALANPRLELFRGAETTPLASNDDWDGSAATKTLFDQVGAFGFADGSKDAALVIALAPGRYSAVISGVNATTGVGLVEIYEVP